MRIVTPVLMTIMSLGMTSDAVPMMIPGGPLWGEDELQFDADIEHQRMGNTRHRSRNTGRNTRSRNIRRRVPDLVSNDGVRRRGSIGSTQSSSHDQSHTSSKSSKNLRVRMLDPRQWNLETQSSDTPVSEDYDYLEALPLTDATTCAWTPRLTRVVSTLALAGVTISTFFWLSRGAPSQSTTLTLTTCTDAMNDLIGQLERKYRASDLNHFCLDRRDFQLHESDSKHVLGRFIDTTESTITRVDEGVEDSRVKAFLYAGDDDHENLQWYMKKQEDESIYTCSMPLMGKGTITISDTITLENQEGPLGHASYSLNGHPRASTQFQVFSFQRKDDELKEPIMGAIVQEVQQNEDSQCLQICVPKEDAEDGEYPQTISMAALALLLP